MTRRATGGIDRDPQNLPIPLGGMAPVRIRRHRWRRALHSPLSTVVLAVGALCGVAGLLALLAPQTVAVSLFGDRLEVGGMTLREVSPPSAQLRRFAGDASYVLAERGHGTATAAAAWTSAGVRSHGLCTLQPQGLLLVEECSFVMGVQHLTSVDVLDPASGSAWQRTYSDGTRVTIAVAPNGAAAPIPFPVGR